MKRFMKMMPLERLALNYSSKIFALKWRCIGVISLVVLNCLGMTHTK